MYKKFVTGLTIREFKKQLPEEKFDIEKGFKEIYADIGNKLKKSKSFKIKNLSKKEYDEIFFEIKTQFNQFNKENPGGKTGRQWDNMFFEVMSNLATFSKSARIRGLTKKEYDEIFKKFRNELISFK